MKLAKQKRELRTRIRRDAEQIIKLESAIKKAESDEPLSSEFLTKDALAKGLRETLITLKGDHQANLKILEGMIFYHRYLLEQKAKGRRYSKIRPNTIKLAKLLKSSLF